MIIEFTLKRNDGTVIFRDTADAFHIYKHESFMDTGIQEGNSKLQGFTYLPQVLGDKRLKQYTISYSDDG